ncbi:MAG: hypothetical protein EA393_10890 [Bacteroidetes bacterium]|nr:MAG: hypothetical protein EA393_10890 [Bacteroidota bacterium]
MILQKTLELLKSKYSSHMDNLVISDVVMGMHLTAVKLSDGSHGIASTLQDRVYYSAGKKRDFGPFTPMQITGQKVMDLFETSQKSKITDTLKVAVLNAVSTKIIANGKYKVIENADPIDLLDLSHPRTITIVGAFHSYIEKLSDSGNRLFVLELNEDALGEEHKKHYVPATEYNKVIPGSDALIITGLTLVNNTIDELLLSVPENCRVVVTGPSGSIIPDVLFQHGVHIIGATRITKPLELFDVVAQGGSGYHLFRYCAEKICILND